MNGHICHHALTPGVATSGVRARRGARAENFTPASERTIRVNANRGSGVGPRARPTPHVKRYLETIVNQERATEDESMSGEVVGDAGF